MSDKAPDNSPPQSLFAKDIASLGFRMEKFRQASGLAYQLSRKGRMPAWIAKYAEWGLSGEGQAALRERPPLPLVQNGEFSTGTLVLQATSISLELEETPGPPFWPWPAWWAMLRWRSLASYWQRELRSNHYQALLGIAPKVWLLDFQPLPPGAVISPWKIDRWPERPEDLEVGEGVKLVRVSASGREKNEGEFLLAKLAPLHNGLALPRVKPVYNARDGVIKLKNGEDE